MIVTGGAGFLGRAVVAALRHRGVREAAITVPRSATCDLRNAAQARDVIERETTRAAQSGEPAPGLTIIHCAGLVGGLGLNRARPADMLHDNLLMGLNVIHAAAHAAHADTGRLAEPRQPVAHACGTGV